MRAISRKCTSKVCTDETEKAIVALEERRCLDVRASLGALGAAAEPGTPLMKAINEAKTGWVTACPLKP